MRTLSLMLLISDVHLGKKTKSYNVDIAKKRMRRLVYELNLTLNKLEKEYRIKDMTIFLLGDILDGETIYPGQGFDVDEFVVKSSQIFIDEFERLIKLFEIRNMKVSVECVYGNHGRANRYGKSNWEEMLYVSLKERMKKYEFVRVDVGSWYIFSRVGNKRVLAIHGDQIKMYQNIPLYGITQKAMRWQNSLGRFDILVLGHFHTAYMMNWNGICIFGNGAMMDGDEWTAKLGLKPITQYWLIGIGEKNNIEYAKLIELR